MNKLTKFICILSTLSYCTNAQPSIQWQHCFGGSSQEFCSDIVTTNDKGYVICSGTYSMDGDILNQHGNGSSDDMWVIRLDSNKNIVWSKCYGGTSFEGASSINQTKDGGFILSGISEYINGDVTENHGGDDAWIIKIDSSGAIQWQKSFGGSVEDIALYAEQTSDNGYIVACNSGSNDYDVQVNYGGSDYWILKLDSFGTIIWQKTFGGSLNEYVRTIKPTLDGGYIIAGNTYSNDSDITYNHGGEDIWIVKIDSIGNMQWQKSYGGSSDDELYNIYPLNNGDYAVVGTTSSVDFDVTIMQGLCDYWLIKIDSLGSIIWQKTYGGSDWDVLFYLLPDVNDGFILSGETFSSDGDVTLNHSGIDVWVVKTDSTGNIIWQNTYGGSLTDAPTGGRCIVKNANGNYVVACTTFSNDGDVSGSHGPCDVWMFELNNTTGIKETQVANDSIRIFPNPFISQITINFEFTPSKASATLIDIYGKIISVFYFSNSGNTNSWHLNFNNQNLSAGIYYLKFETNYKSVVKKLIKL